MDIVKALHQRASALNDELGKINQAIRALTGNLSQPKAGTRNTGKRKFRHTAAPKRKLALAQKKIWAAKHKRK